MQLQVVENKESQELLESIRDTLMSNNNFFKGRLSKIEKRKKKKGKIYPRLILDSGAKITDPNKISLHLFSSTERNTHADQQRSYASSNDDFNDVQRIYERRNLTPIKRDESGKIMSEKEYSGEDEYDEVAKTKDSALKKSSQKMEERQSRQKPNNVNNNIEDYYQNEMSEKRVEENLQEYLQNEFKSNKI